MSDPPDPSDAIYFDTNLIIQAGWPSPSTRLLELLSQATELGLGLYLPDVVRAEMEVVWIREVQSSRSSLHSKIESFNRNAGFVLNVPAIGELPDAAAIGKIIKERTASFEARFQQVPTTTASLEDFLQLAIKRQGPFSKSGANFKDAVILWSILDHMVAKGIASATLATGDKDFRDDEVSFVANKFSRSITLVSDLDKLEAIITARFSAQQTKLIEDNKRLLKQVFEKQRDALERFLSNSLVLRLSDLSAFGSVYKILSCKVSSIKDVHFSSPSFESASVETEAQNVSADVQVALLLEVLKFKPAPDPTFGIGAKVNHPIMDLDDYSQRAEVVQETRELLVTVEGKIESSSNGSGAVTFSSASINKTGLGFASLLGILGG